MRSEFWEQFEGLAREVRREACLNGSGRKARPSLAPAFARYSDVWRRESVAELASEARDGFLSRDRAAAATALSELVWLRLSAAAAAVDEEVAAHDASAVVSLGPREIAYRTAEALAVTATRAETRRELASACDRVVEEVNDLRGERLERMHAAAPGLCADAHVDGGTHADLWSSLFAFSYAETASAAASLLAATERPYADALEAALRGQPEARAGAARPEDVAHLCLYPGPAGMFRPSRLAAVYRDTLAGLGIRAGAQANVTLDAAERPAKVPRAFCAPVEVPGDVRLVLRPSGGHRDVRDLLRVAGEGQWFAFTSPSARPEFRLGVDPAAAAAWGALLESLARRPEWLADAFGVEKSARDLFRAVGLECCLRARTLAALAVYEAEVHSGARPLASAPDRYAELMTEATRAEAGRARYLVDLGTRFEAASGLRGLALEAQARDFLMTRFGTRWWQSRTAGALLKELWAAGGEYGAAAVASELGLGPLAFDALEAELSEGLSR